MSSDPSHFLASDSDVPFISAGKKKENRLRQKNIRSKSDSIFTYERGAVGLHGVIVSFCAVKQLILDYADWLPRHVIARVGQEGEQEGERLISGEGGRDKTTTVT